MKSSAPGMLPEHRCSRLRSLPLTYEDVGKSAQGPVPGYGWFSKRHQLERHDFAAAAEELFSWQVQARAGLGVQAEHIPLVEGTIVEMSLGRGRFAVRIPCRVVEVVDVPDAKGFAYGTLPGHPEEGEERFILHRQSGSLCLEISAFSRPGRWFTRLGGPVARRFQDYMTDRYLRALDHSSFSPQQEQ